MIFTGQWQQLIVAVIAAVVSRYVLFLVLLTPSFLIGKLTIKLSSQGHTGITSAIAFIDILVSYALMFVITTVIVVIASQYVHPVWIGTLLGYCVALAPWTRFVTAEEVASGGTQGLSRTTVTLMWAQLGTFLLALSFNFSDVIRGLGYLAFAAVCLAGVVNTFGIAHKALKTLPDAFEGA
jgi:hypothetical protein